MDNLKNILKNIKVDYVFYVLLLGYFVFALFFSTFRDAIRDETIYIHETYLISELLQNGVWIGNYAVGLHGFLFKIPPAIVFIFTGPSVFILTLYNILLAMASSYFFYRFLKKAFKWNLTALLVTGILMANFHFILSTPTYLREMPSLLIVVLLFYAIFSNWRPWVLGIVFLLLLDVKEYLFFMFGLGYFIWIVLKNIRIYSSKSFYEKLLKIIWESIQVFGFSFIWIILMFTTSILPVNMFLASILGLIDRGVEYLVTHFSVDTASTNLLKDEEVREIFRFTVHEDYPIYLKIILNLLNTILSYIGKILYPRTFSFLSVPKVIVLPAVYMAVKFLKKTWSEKKIFSNSLNIIFPILMLTYLALYLLRASHGRYLLPIVPLISIYFVYFLYYKKHNRREVKKVLLATLVFVILGFVFEASYLLPKVILELSLFLCIAFSVLEPFNFSKLFYVIFRKFTIAFCVIAMLSASLLFAITQGQAKHSILFGQNREIKEVVEIIPDESKFWINNFESYGLMAVYFGQTYEWPEWKWDLAPYVPKKTLLRAYGEKYAYDDMWMEVSKFRRYIYKNDIEYVVFMESQIEEESFGMQHRLEDVIDKEWLELERVEELKNKKIYLFKVIYD
jgi:hypothetical protein